MIMERYLLAENRVKELLEENSGEQKYQDYFREVAAYLSDVLDTCDAIRKGEWQNRSLQEKQENNRKLYSPLMEENYKKNDLNPAVAAVHLGKDTGPFLSALYAELQSLPAFCFEQDYQSVTMRLELFLEIYGEISDFLKDGEEVDLNVLKESYASFAQDYQDEFMMDAVERSFTTKSSFARDIVCNSDLSRPDYLYSYGEYITDSEIRMSRFMNELPEEQIVKIADTFTEGYRKGFIATGKDIHKKKTVAIRYFIGFERVVRKAIENFRDMGLDSILYRAQPSFLQGRNMNKVGYYATSPNKQFDCDHEFDKVIYYSSAFTNRKLECYKAALEEYKEETGVFGGPAVIEDFGEEPFCPEDKEENYKFGRQEQQRSVEYTAKAGALLNQYVKGEERSFTIIDFPTPHIGKNFEELFLKTVEINTLNYERYRDIQQKIIDVLDTAEHVEIRGQGANVTDLSVRIMDLKDPAHETAFENCVADVNIPVGEVFTSPVLRGTAGVLHVTEVFLNGRKFENLKLTFKDGVIDSYSCSNFKEEEQGRKYIKDHILFQHETLPMGEFAIGTNTVAYQVAREYHIEKLFPILIAEKTGPHFAVGDTCYSHEEDIVTYNPDGKAIVARENDFSRLRKEDVSRAYFNCHTDITIPYDELGLLEAVTAGGERIPIIRNGKFVLKGCEELNGPLEKEISKNTR